MTNETRTTSASTALLDDADDPRDLLARALATGVAVVGGIRPDQMELPTPCGAYDVRGLVAHLVSVLDRLVVIGSRGDVFAVPDQADIVPDEEWVTRWHTTVHRVLDVWADDALLDDELQLPWTILAGAPALGIYGNEISVHTWDLAHATGQRPRWDAEVLEWALRAVHRELPDEVRAPMWAEVVASIPDGVPFEAPFGDAVAVAADADLIDRLVAWNGRRP